MEMSEDSKEVKDVLQNIIKAKKAFRMYPVNNPIYIKTLEDLYGLFQNYFDYKDDLTLKVNQNSISYDTEQIYYNPEKEDNIAFFFFKDGLREISFKKGLLREELEEFLKIIAFDFDREMVDDDVVTLLWEKDFENIRYVVDEAFLIDIDEEDYESKVSNKVKEEVTDADRLMKAYTEIIKEESIEDIPIIPITDRDLQMLLTEMEKDSADKTDKLVTILFEILYQSEGASSILEDALMFLKETIKFSMKQGDIDVVLKIMQEAKEMLNSPLSAEAVKKYMRMILLYPGNAEIISILGEVLESGIEIKENSFKEFVELLDKNAISPLIKILGDLKTIRVRKIIIEALIILGKKDIKAIARGLDDQRWFVVRNIIYIMRNIGDKGAIDFLLKTVKHDDIRVRKEVIKTLGELGGQGVFQTLRECLDDPDMQVRIASARAMSTIGSEVSKKTIIEKIFNKAFNNKPFEEKKEFYEILSRWKDEEVFNFLISVLKKKSFFNRAKNYENKACAICCLGLLGNKDALPFLSQFRDSHNELLREFSNTAIKRIEYGH
ncbi:MAG: HEAT repeat domain-containing protein [Nitrospirota bacterium]|nr:HEAT repeat domain-containing protein [Nitrospirota bacterium]MDH5767820.1 HEAT repeat domain-containing protein [Nitrospirota bacterium]